MDDRIEGSACQLTLVFVIDGAKKRVICDDADYLQTNYYKVLLGMKKRGFGINRYNGFGGKVEASDNSIREAAARELQEECGIHVHINDLEELGRLYFRFEDNPIRSDVSVFLTETYLGEPCETDEMAPSWFSFKDIPFNEMWPDDEYWLSGVLERRKVTAYVDFAADLTTIKNMSIQWDVMESYKSE